MRNLVNEVSNEALPIEDRNSPSAKGGDLGPRSLSESIKKGDGYVVFSPEGPEAGGTRIILKWGGNPPEENKQQKDEVEKGKQNRDKGKGDKGEKEKMQARKGANRIKVDKGVLALREPEKPREARKGVKIRVHNLIRRVEEVKEKIREREKREMGKRKKAEKPRVMGKGVKKRGKKRMEKRERARVVKDKVEAVGVKTRVMKVMGAMEKEK
jgi:hypothetical protein